MNMESGRTGVADAIYARGVQEHFLERLRELDGEMERLSQEFRTAHPFPSIAIDNFLPPMLATALADEFPRMDSAIWTRLPTEDQKHKSSTIDEGAIPPGLRSLIHELNSGTFLGFLERLTGIPDLIADTKCVGGGLHQIRRGGKLAVHVDYSHHPQNGLFRRLNLLLYLNRDWREDYGGNLELWNPEITRCERKILPVFNRAALFATSDISYHGHPEPLSCPDGMTRNSVALYYFTKEPPAGKENVVHNTLFKSRPGDRIHLGNVLVRAASSGFFRDLMPPVLYRGLRKMWNRRYTGR
ncbi:MAG: 2OG-Fe(II) oxygenase [Pseudomonadales bacterium]|nr:2OG-Fe(II) oxygenase [Pseudomonadales bacterium]